MGDGGGRTRKKKFIEKFSIISYEFLVIRAANNNIVVVITIWPKEKKQKLVMSGDKIAKNLNFLIPLCSICVCVWRTHRNFSSFIHWWLLLAGLFSHPMDPLKLLIYISLYSAFGDVQCSSEERKEFEIFSNIRQKNIHEENVKSFPSMLGGENVWLKVVVTLPLSFFILCVVNFRPTFSVFVLLDTTHISQCHHHLSKPSCCLKSRKIMATFMALHTLPSLYHPPSLMSSTFVDIRSVCRVSAIV